MRRPFTVSFKSVLMVLPLLALAGGSASSWARPAEPVASEDELLLDDDELLLEEGEFSEEETPPPRARVEETVDRQAAEAHSKLFVEDAYPSATVCRTCHADHYREWSISQHSYSQISPVLQAMQGLVLQLTNGTAGDFCIRCHNPVGMNLGEPLFMTSIDRHPTSREGVTCIVCHRVEHNYGKLSGRLFIERGSLFAPVYGPSGNAELQRVLAHTDQYRVVTDPSQRGRGIHTDVVRFEPIQTSAVCGTCHDVNLPDNLRFEEAFSEWKNSTDAKAGVSCQDCHMSTQPGLASGYAEAPAAVVGGVPTRPRKRTDHRFAGPDHSVVHPGIFPHNSKAQELATIREWLSFDYKAGWGTEEFEREVPEGYEFPPRWSSLDDRYDARAIVDANLKLLDEIAEERRKILKIGYQLGEPVVERAKPDGIRFRVPVHNGTTAHNVPTGLDNERMVFLRVTLSDAQGRIVFQSGDPDPDGDLRDQHSTWVHNGDIPMDTQVFTLRSKFIVSMLRGGDREQVAPVAFSTDALPFVRPAVRPAILYGRPAESRKHKRGLPPGGERVAKYDVSARDLAGSTPPYRLDVKLIAGMIPINLVTVIQVVGFDFGMSPREVARNVSAGYQILWERQLDIEVDAN